MQGMCQRADWYFVEHDEKSQKTLLRGVSIDMCNTCFHVFHMGSMIQIRNVPEALHRQLKSRAAMAGMSLSDYLLGEIRHIAERPTPQELRDRLHSRPATNLEVTPVDAIRAERDRV